MTIHLAREIPFMSIILQNAAAAEEGQSDTGAEEHTRRADDKTAL